MPRYRIKKKCLSVCVSDGLFLEKKHDWKKAWVGVHGSKKILSKIQTSGKHVLDNLRDKNIKKTHQQRLRKSGGAAPSGGRGGRSLPAQDHKSYN